MLEKSRKVPGQVDVPNSDLHNSGHPSGELGESHNAKSHPGSFRSLPKPFKLCGPLDALSLLLLITDVGTGNVYLKHTSNWAESQKRVPCKGFPLYLVISFQGPSPLGSDSDNMGQRDTLGNRSQPHSCAPCRGKKKKL